MIHSPIYGHIAIAIWNARISKKSLFASTDYLVKVDFMTFKVKVDCWIIDIAAE